MNLTQGQLSKASPQIWFERGEAKDRKLVVQVLRASHLQIQIFGHPLLQRLREHVEDPDRLPILIFPEGLPSLGIIFSTAFLLRHLHQQHQRDAVQEGILRGRWHDISSRDQI